MSLLGIQGSRTWLWAFGIVMLASPISFLRKLRETVLIKANFYQMFGLTSFQDSWRLARDLFALRQALVRKRRVQPPRNAVVCARALAEALSVVLVVDRTPGAGLLAEMSLVLEVKRSALVLSYYGFELQETLRRFDEVVANLRLDAGGLRLLRRWAVHPSAANAELLARRAARSRTGSTESPAAAPLV